MRLGLSGDRDVRLLWSAAACLSATARMLQISVALHVLAVAGTAALAAVQLAGVLPALLLMLNVSGALRKRSSSRTSPGV